MKLNLKKPSIRITLRYSLIALVSIVSIALLVPYVLNYGPESINTPFDIQMSYISYTQQFTVIYFAIIIILAIFVHLALKDVDEWYSLPDEKKYTESELIKKVRKKCFNLPYLTFIFEITLPLILVSFILLITGSHHATMIVKLLFLVVSYSFLLAVITYIFSKNVFEDVLTKTYKKNLNIGVRISIGLKVAMQILPIFAAGVMVTAVIGYSRIVAEKENTFFDLYHQQLYTTFSISQTYYFDDVVETMRHLTLEDENHSAFVIMPDHTIRTLRGPEVSEFVKEYTLQLSPKYNGRTYDSYGIDAQGSTIKLKTTVGDIYVGILFNVESNAAAITFVITFGVLMLLIILVLYIFGKSLSSDLSDVSNNFNDILKGESDLTSSLPVKTNDEIGDLILAFNGIQEQQAAYLEQIQNNQSMLMEQERLASLGQMIGGISHNLKTPIMSIAGAAQGLNNLINEYDASIGDKDVTNDDHHAIAKDMREWISKINSYTNYMSDIIGAVKGQAATLSESEEDTFTLFDLIKRIQILMKNELQNNHIQFNISLNQLEQKEIKGNVNSLVQVINNLITNAIQAYRGNPGEINLSTQLINDELDIAIEDHGCGMPKDVQEKLFKEMVTTKGKNGTGLGLFMSYSTIKGKFDGDITFTSEEGKGTVFHIHLPIK